MPWNNQGGSGGSGGPWGNPGGSGGGNQGGGSGNGGGNSPWGRPGGGRSGGGGGGQMPPDIEDIFRKGQDRLRQSVPGGFGGARGVIGILVLALAVWAANGFYTVQPEQVGLVMRFGQWVRTEPPGLRYHLPYPVETVERPNVEAINTIDIGFREGAGARSYASSGSRDNVTDVPDESLMLTGDENIIDIDFAVQWKISDPVAYSFNIRRPEETVRKAAESAMREVIGRTDIQPALTEARADIEKQTFTILQKLMDEYKAGVEITSVKLLDVKAPQAVIESFDDVQRARADRERLRNEAESYRNKIIPVARGNAERVLQEAQAYREQVVAKANGDAQRFDQIYESYKSAKDVTLRRLYLETMEQVLSRSKKIIIEDGTAGGKGTGGVVPYLPLDQLTRGSNAGRTVK